MKHVTALIIKFLMIAVVLEVLLTIMTSLNFGDILYIAAAVTIITYIIGDLLILPASNNTVATIADIGLAFVVIYVLSLTWRTMYISLVDALVVAVAIGLGEWFFHRYIYNNVLSHKEQH